ncbi:MarR family winged helix-turn-helix transcriptional regulator [Chloroflexota bacterium]
MRNILSGDELYDIWVLLRRTDLLVLKVRDRELSKIGLSPVRVALLNVVHALKGKATPAEIARQLLRESHSISPLVTKMTREGILEKTVDSERKNMVRISLTKKGRTIRKQSNNTRENIYNIMSVLSEEERRQMKVYLQRIQDCAAKTL